LTKRWRLAFSKIDLRFGWLVLLALLAQSVVIYVDFGDADVLRRFVFPASYVLLVTFVVLNRRRVGFLVIGIGMLLNLLVIVANGGLMPIAPATMERAGLEDELVELELGDSVPQTKNVLLDEGDTHLELLSDRITWGSSGPVPVFSIGDAVIGIGLIIILVELLLPKLQRPPRDRLSPT
jgi:hypothetical protein